MILYVRRNKPCTRAHLEKNGLTAVAAYTTGNPLQKVLTVFSAPPVCDTRWPSPGTIFAAMTR